MGSTLTLGDELLFPSEYVKSQELKGRATTLTIASVGKQELQMRGGSKKISPVLTFKEVRKKLVCNRTNAESIAVSHGPKAELWVGKKITLYPTRCRFGREVVDCIRVKEPNGVPHDNIPNEFDNLGSDTVPPDAHDGTDPVGSSSEAGDSLGAGANDPDFQPEPPEDSQTPPVQLPNPCELKQITNLLLLQAPEHMDANTAMTCVTSYLNVKLSKKWERLKREEQIKYYEDWTANGFPPFKAT